MVKTGVPGQSSQELYTVSVESMPRYGHGAGHCCQPGRVGKDLLCGVLIALAVICVAVAVFLVAFFVVNGSGDVARSQDNNHTALDSSPLTRNQEAEEEFNLNSLNVWDKDLSSTSLPNIDISYEPHSPSGHVEYPPPAHEIVPSDEESVNQPHHPQPQLPPEKETDSSAPQQPQDGLVVEEHVHKGQTSSIPDDDAVIDPSINQTDPMPPPEVSTMKNSDNITGLKVISAQTILEEEASDGGEEISTESPSPAPSPVVSIDSAPWIPITPLLPSSENGSSVVSGLEEKTRNETSKVAVISEPTNAETISNQTLGLVELEQLREESPTAATDVAVSKEADPVAVADVATVKAKLPNGEEETTELAMTHGVGSMALLVPEDRNQHRSQSGDVPLEGSEGAAANNTNDENVLGTEWKPIQEDECIRRQLEFCRGVLPYTDTKLPNWVGDVNEAERNLSVPYFEIIAESECHPRVQQYACAVLEPPCRQGVSIPPCQQFCRAIAEDCKSYVLSALSLALVLDCDQFPLSNDPSVCFNLASTTSEGECLPGEYRCNDNSCIPERWVCDGKSDCFSDGDDELACSLCTDQEFKCESENRCIPIRWKCDGSRDCGDASDERECNLTQDCGDGQFRCQDGLSCIPLRRVCDGANHCRDNSDEDNCTAIACQNGDFKCHENGVCIPRQWVCDSNSDCKDDSDEFNCTLTPFDASGNQTEIAGPDGSNSSVVETESNPDKCPLGELLCISDGACIRFEQLCDGANDCSDGADETDCGGSDSSEQ